MNKKLIFSSLIFIFVIIVGKGWLDDNRRAPLKNPSQINWVPPKEEQFELLAKNSSCFFDEASCSLELPDGTKLELSIEPKPIQPNKNLTIKLKSSSEKFKPIAVDLQGLNLNMGFIRPLFKEFEPSQYLASVNLPICDEKNMNWKALVLFEEQGNPDKKIAAQFFFNSSAP